MILTIDIVHIDPKRYLNLNLARFWRRSLQGEESSGSISYLLTTSPIYLAVFLMRFSFAFTVVALQWLVPIAVDRGVISSAYPVMEMATGFFFGVLADRIGRKWIVVGGLLASSLVTVSFTFTRSIVLLTLIHGLQGICAAAIVTSTLALVADFARKSSRGREMGIYDFCTIAGYAIGFVFALLLIDGRASRSLEPFYAGASIALIGAVVSAVALRDARLSSRATPFSLGENLRRMSSDRVALTLIPVWFVLMVIIGVFLTYTRELAEVTLGPSPHFPFFFGPGAAHFGAGSTRLGILGVVVIIFVAILLGFTQSSFGTLSDRFGRGRIILIGQASIFGLSSILGAMIFFNLNRFFVLPFVALFAAGVLAFTPAALAELADIAPETGRGAAMGLYSITVGAGTIFGPLAGGALINEYGTSTGLAAIFGIGAAITFIVLLFHLFWRIKGERIDPRRERG